MILLVVVAALLAAIVGILIWQNNSGPSPAVTSTDGAPAADGSASATSTPGMPPGGTAPAVDFDPKTAPKVAKDQTPEEYVKAYYQLCSDGKYADAFKLLPTATQAYYGDEAGFESTLSGYGITGFEVSPQVESGDSISVVGTQQAQGMAFPYTWAFVKGDDGSWLCQSRTMGGGQ
ncbi:MAG: hypothetical protein Q8K99_12465 [Actinomycetota bacterium]|nr:hypothetical protein [Actinomycetota bacterium]